MAERALSDEEINEILDRYEGEVTEEDRRLLLWIALGLGYDISIFSARIEREIAVLRASGTTELGIIGAIRRDYETNGRIFGELRNSVKRGVVLGIMQSSRLGQSAIYGDSVESFKWVTMQGGRVCEDCQPRAGEIATWQEWESIGMPGTGWSRCGGNCYCMLVPVGVKVSDTVKRA